jgi:protein CMS1
MSNVSQRALRQFQNKDSAVAKLFAKHIKLDEARETVKKTRCVELVMSLIIELRLTLSRMGIGIGTPVRLTDLVDSGMLD